MLAAHIAERIELAKIVRNIALIRFTAQQAVDDAFQILGVSRLHIS